jgi:hypothetical protein
VTPPTVTLESWMSPRAPSGYRILPLHRRRRHRSTTVTVTGAPLIRAQSLMSRPTPLPELRYRHRPHVGLPPYVARCHLHRRPGLPPSIARPSGPAVHIMLASGAAPDTAVVADSAARCPSLPATLLPTGAHRRPRPRRLTEPLLPPRAAAASPVPP